MATPAYVPLDPNKPSGPTQAPDAYSASDLANVRALRDAVILGGPLSGWQYSTQGGTASRPLNRIWANGALRLLMQTTYAGALQLPSVVGWFWSNDSAGSYITMGPNSGLVWDANANLVSVSQSAGSWISWLAGYHMALYGTEAFGGHAAGVGNAVHGLGTMSTQNANAVAITGGSALNLGTDSMYLHAVLRIYPKAPAYLVNGAVWNWAAYTGNHDNIVAGNSIANIAGIASGEVKRLFVSGAGAITIGSGGISFNWAVGHPVWSTGAGTLINCVAINGAYVMGTTIPLP